MRLLLFNMVTDADDPILGFTSIWVNALARHCTAVDVITMSVGRLAVAENVHVYSLGKERGYSEPRRALKFYRVLWRLLRTYRYEACFAHMIPLFAIMGAPLLRLYRVPVTLWYAHKAVPRQLVIAEKLVQHVVSASPESFRLPSDKLIITGHGIDTDVFKPAHVDPNTQPLSSSSPPPFTILTVGRVAPAKRLTTLIDAAAVLRDTHHLRDFRVRIVGGVYPQDEAYADRLHAHVQDLQLQAYVEFVGAVKYEAVVYEYQTADVMVNLSATGSLDKAVLEAMACGIPSITANPAFHNLLARWHEVLIVPMDDAPALAAQLAYLAAQPPQMRQQLGRDLRVIVTEQHSLAQLTHKLLQIFTHPPQH
jgi:glycosyltransferase involved in cell wall biosynthesis